MSNILFAPRYRTYDAFGDSITLGTNASVTANRYINLVGAKLGLTPTNHGVSGAQAADLCALIYQSTPPDSVSSQLYTYMIGTNDQNIYSNDTDKITNFSLFQQAGLAYLAIPNSNKLLGQSASITYGGTWTNSSLYGGAMSKQSTVNGSTATFTAYGPTIYIAYTMQDSNGGTFTVTVDGSNAFSPNTYTNSGTNGKAILTNNGGTSGSGLLRITGLGAGIHTVVITVASATSASNVVTIDWVASVSGNQFPYGPQVVCGGLPRRNDPSTVPLLYLAKTKENVAALAADGLNVVYADIPSYITNPATDLDTDNTHPLDAGHAKIANGFLSTVGIGSIASVKQAIWSLMYGMLRTVAQIADGTLLAGNTRGPNAVDLQTLRTTNTHVASGNYSSIFGGTSNTASGTYSGAAGNQNIASGAICWAIGDQSAATGNRSHARGTQATDRARYGADVWASNFLATRGDAQISTSVLRGTGNSTSAVRLTSDGAAAGSANCINIPNNTAYLVTIDVVAFDHTTVTKSESWSTWTGLLTRGANAASTAITMNTTPTPITNGTVTGSSIAATADTTNGGINLSFTPPSANTDTWNIVARVTAVEVQ
jgi:lysophospholipase L1-like esterase